MTEAERLIEKKKDLDRKIEQLKEQRKMVEQKEKTRERKMRNHRLIQLGAIIESHFRTEVDPEIYAMYLGTRLRRDGEDSITIGEYQKDQYLKVADRKKD